ncbi:DUF2891 domain-containing protein [Parasphingorhabdus halotolerans]|uniref:DUF2891 domain-containing protein n=1 Tax=Parasphingorhabdus halotolerans TaxID=2725558 RepID=A0A6H2DNU9_9SPHN|nr:DUF2891 domain-containing protein [Parasphingorhabdus halotolerans]QJB70342.1 DUF2891 domain-containing protein [Parasphingorhabdus halotolerans]
MRFSLLIIISATLAGCSIKTDEEDKNEETRGYFERKNVAPDPADNARLPRKVEHTFARIALDCINKQYPNKISHVLTSRNDVAEPSKLTPVFYGCFDWHSAVHGHWLLTRLWGQNSVADMDSEIEAALDANFTADKIKGEVAYFSNEDRKAFERPYGIAWFLQLTAELKEISVGETEKAEKAQLWLGRLRPLETIITDRINDWVPKLAYPIRLGTHNQSAFAFGLFLDWARISGNVGMEKLIVDKSLAFHRADKNCPLSYEPSGEDFLSPCLMEADLMRRIMPQQEFAAWLTTFLPNIPKDGSGDWLAIGVVNDPTDGKLVHLDGVNLSRAWALQGIASALPQDDPRVGALIASANLHGNAGEKSVSTPHYSGSHWLASFATYLRTQRGISSQNTQVAPAPVPTRPSADSE